MQNINIGQRSTSSSQEPSEPILCWICLCTDNDEDDYENIRNWVSPCKCRGSSRWVHQDCLLRWIDEKLNEDHTSKTHCPQCLTQYIIVYDRLNYLVQLLNILDRTVNKIAPSLVDCVLRIIVCWLAECYGAITIMQIMGEEEAITMMENTNPYLLLMMLPTIPVSLIVGKMINWQETLILFVQRFTPQLPLFRIIMPSFLYEPDNSSVGIINPSRAILVPSFLAALLLPTNAIIVGNLLFGNSSYSCLQKTLLGGLVYIAVKGVVRMYQKQQNNIRERILDVLEYPETDDEENN